MGEGGLEGYKKYLDQQRTLLGGRLKQLQLTEEEYLEANPSWVRPVVELWSGGEVRDEFHGSIVEAEGTLNQAREVLERGDLAQAAVLLRQASPQVENASSLWRRFMGGVAGEPREKPKVYSEQEWRERIVRIEKSIQKEAVYREYGLYFIQRENKGDRLKDLEKLWNAEQAVFRRGGTVDRVMKRLYSQRYFRPYKRGTRRVSGLLEKTGGNCVARTILIVAALIDSGIDLKGWEVGVQLFKNHIQAVLIKKNGDHVVVWNPLKNSRTEKIIAPVFRPELLLQASQAGLDRLIPSEDLKMLSARPEDIPKTTLAADYPKQEIVSDEGEEFSFPDVSSVFGDGSPPPSSANDIDLTYPEESAGIEGDRFEPLPNFGGLTPEQWSDLIHDRGPFGATAREALAKKGGEAVPMLLVMVEDTKKGKKEGVGMTPEILLTLALIGPEAAPALDEIFVALYHPDYYYYGEIEVPAARALSGIGREGIVIPRAIEFLQNPGKANNAAIQEVIVYLGWCGPAARAALPVLEQYRRYNQDAGLLVPGEVRRATRSAIKNIKGGEVP